MVITIEPGLYFMDQPDTPEPLRAIGITNRRRRVSGAWWSEDPDSVVPKTAAELKRLWLMLVRGGGIWPHFG